MKKEHLRLWGGGGVLVLGAACVTGAALAGPGPADRLLVLAAMLGLGLLAGILVQKEGKNRELTAILLPIIGLALLLRALLLPHETLDYQNFLTHWVATLRDNGGFAALKLPIGNYNVPYLYILAALSYLPIRDLWLIKLVSILFDVLLAWGGWRLVRAAGGGERACAAAFSVVLLLPTVVLNGACWGQCDAIWAAFCVHALADALDRHPLRSVSLMALAFAFKLQAIFLLPLWGALWFCGRVKFRHLWAFPGVFFLTMVPALLLGKPAGDILSVYLNQAGDSAAWQTLNYNSPSIVTLFPLDHEPGAWGPAAGIALAFLLVLTVLGLFLWKRTTADNGALVLAGVLLSLGVPFLLPYMHERYFFLGGVLLAIWACMHHSAAIPAAGAELASLGGYHAYLLVRYFLPVRLFGLVWTQLLEGLLMLMALICTAVMLGRQLKTR